jgi:hypothetical protein
MVRIVLDPVDVVRDLGNGRIVAVAAERVSAQRFAE